MRIAILGASGRLGRHLVRKALDAGHRVVAFARFPIFLHFSRHALTIMRGDSKDERAVERALSDVEAVITVLGVDAGIAPSSTKRAATAVISAMKRAGVRRLVWQTGSGVPYMGETLFGSRKAMRTALGLIGPPALQNVEEGLRPVMESDLDFTIVRFNRIALVLSRRRAPAQRTSARPKPLSPDEAAEIILAQLAEITHRQPAGRPAPVQRQARTGPQKEKGADQPLS